MSIRLKLANRHLDEIKEFIKSRLTPMTLVMGYSRRE